MTKPQREVLEFLTGKWATDREGAAALGLNQRTYTGRRVWLQRRGLVRPVGARREADAKTASTIWTAGSPV